MATVLRVLILLSVLSLASARLRFVEAGHKGRPLGALRNGFVFCPPKRGFSIECLPPWKTRAVKIIVNGKGFWESKRPFFSRGNSGRYVRPLHPGFGSITVTCTGKGYYKRVKGTIRCSSKKPKNPGNKPKNPPKKPHKPHRPRGLACVTRKGTQFVGGLRRGWKRTGHGGVTFRPGSKYGGTVGPNYSVLKYTFKVPYASTYGVVVDMGTKHWTEHNDLWMKCDGGFIALRHGSRKVRPGFIKVYHNCNGRCKEASTVDHHSHNIVTRSMYKPGRTYTCYIGARSTMTTLFGIILFPCSGKQCNRHSAHWQKHAKKCHA